MCIVSNWIWMLQEICGYFNSICFPSRKFLNESSSPVKLLEVISKHKLSMQRFCQLRSQHLERNSIVTYHSEVKNTQFFDNDDSFSLFFAVKVTTKTSLFLFSVFSFPLHFKIFDKLSRRYAFHLLLFYFSDFSDSAGMRTCLLDYHSSPDTLTQEGRKNTHFQQGNDFKS